MVDYVLPAEYPYKDEGQPGAEPLRAEDYNPLLASVADLGAAGGRVASLEAGVAGKQPLDADLTTIAGLAPTDNDVIQRKAGAWTNRTPAQVKTDLALVKGDVGLGNVDNTSDAAKPISTATQAALDGKQPLDSDLTTIAGLTPTTDNIIQSTAGAWASRTPAQLKTTLALVKGDVGLGNVDNTSDASKPISAATQTALDLKVSSAVWPAPRSGRYFFPLSPNSTATGTTGIGTMRVAPWLVMRTISLSRIGAEVSTAGEAGSLVRLVIYADNGSGFPGALVVDAGTINGDSATVQELTINVTLQPGLYWPGGAVQNVTTTQPTLRLLGAHTPAVAITMDDAALPAANDQVLGYAGAATGAAPATFPTGNSGSGLAPRILLKVT